MLHEYMMVIGLVWGFGGLRPQALNPKPQTCISTWTLNPKPYITPVKEPYLGTWTLADSYS